MLRARGVEVCAVSTPSFRTDVAAIGAIARVEPAERVVVSLCWPDRIGCVLGAADGARVVGVVHCLPETVGLAWPGPALFGRVIGGALERRAWRRLDAVVAVSDALVDPLVAHTPVARARVAVVPNPAFAVDASERADPPPLRLLALGRVDEKKRIDVVIDALARLPRDAPWSLDVVGDGPARAALEAKTVRARLGDRVRFHGVALDPSPYIAQAHALVFASERENSPLAPLEALASGVAVIAADVPPLRDALPSAGVAWARAGDAASWAAQIRALLEDPGRARALGEAGRVEVERTRSEARWADAMRAVLLGAGASTE